MAHMQTNDFWVGGSVGAIIWLVFISMGATVPINPSLIDPIIRVITPQVSLFKALLFYIAAGGVIGVLVGEAKRRLM